MRTAVACALPIVVATCAVTGAAFSPLSSKSHTIRFPHQSRRLHYRHVLFGNSNTTVENGDDETPKDHLKKQAPEDISTSEPIVVEIDGIHYNLTAWANAHPGGPAVLQKYHNQDATKAFRAVGHSETAYRLLSDFEIADTLIRGYTLVTATKMNQFKRVRQKMFTNEDPGVHKCFGLFVLGHFLFRYVRAFFSSDPTCGLGRTASAATILFCLLPHAILSLSSLIFHVPAERVVGRPMIWQEYRAHNIVFALRSVLCTALSWIGLRYGHVICVRRAVLGTTLAVVVLAGALADEATKRLRYNDRESTTATMPYWDGCSEKTQQRFKTFYAYSQYMATLACLSVSNPFWPFMVLLPIQLVSLQMTLVRKGFMSVKAFHLIYAGSLALPYIISVRQYFMTGMVQILGSYGLGAILFWLRTRGLSKYWIWPSIGAARCAGGNLILNWQWF